MRFPELKLLRSPELSSISPPNTHQSAHLSCSLLHSSKPSKNKIITPAHCFLSTQLTNSVMQTKLAPRSLVHVFIHWQEETVFTHNNQYQKCTTDLYINITASLGALIKCAATESEQRDLLKSAMYLLRLR